MSSTAARFVELESEEATKMTFVYVYASSLKLRH